MSIFGTIRERIFGHAQAQVVAPQPAETAPVPSAVPSASPAPKPQPAVDVNAILAAKAQSHPERLNWQTSIVDLMKLLELDSSLDHRKELARELQYPLPTHDTAAMNEWLHEQVMQKLADNSGQVPDTLR